MKNKFPLLTFVIVITLMLAACATPSASVATQQLSTEAPAVQADSTVKISLVNFSFSPKELTIKKGTTVAWTNEDSAVHTVTSDTNVFDSGNLSKGDMFSYTFDTAGTFPYYCIPHAANMKGTIVVTE